MKSIMETRNFLKLSHVFKLFLSSRRSLPPPPSSPMSSSTRPHLVSREEREWRLPDLPSKCRWTAGGSTEPDPHQHEVPASTSARKSSVLPNVLHWIGDTPLIRVNHLVAEEGLRCEVYAKCEFFNAGGSVKDRVARRMVEEAERRGQLKPGATIIEPTSGNTGIGIAIASAVKGYRCVFVMPDNMSGDKVDVLRALGAEIVRTPKDATFHSPDSVFGVAARLRDEIPGAVFLDQYSNPYNPLSHYDATAEEILTALDGRVDMLVAGVGTGGTVTGVGRKLKEKCPGVEVVGVDPNDSPLSPDSAPEAGARRWEVEGIGSMFVPTMLSGAASVIDRWVKVSDKESFLMARRLIRSEGLLCGGSSGSAMAGAIAAAKGLKEGQRCVVILSDSIRNYLSKFVSDEWMQERSFLESELPGDPAKGWWWNRNISALQPSVPATVEPRTSCREAMEIMHRGGLDQIPVADKEGVVVGVVTVDNLLRGTLNGTASAEDPVSKLASGRFKQVGLETTLGQLAHLLDSERFVVVGETMTLNGSKAKQKKILGLITRIDLLNFIQSGEKDNSKDVNGVHN